MKTDIREAAACSERELEAFERLALEGGAVTSGGLANRVREARWLGFTYAGHRLVGIAAIKDPLPGYRNDVFAAAGVSAEAPRYPLELGWVVTCDDYRGSGIGSALCGELLVRTGPVPVFATTLADNHAMLTILARLGFEARGDPYSSGQHPGKLIRLLVRPA